jgi:fibro-slime domain-containing protein
MLDPGIVASQLGADGTPVYAGDPMNGTLTTHSAADFTVWYHDVPGVNLSTTLMLPLMPDQSQAGTNTFDNQAFFPVDGQLFGNQGQAHNYQITLEAHAKVVYSGGEEWGFSSDDDLWIFVNGHLVVDLGGLHSGTSQSVKLDQVASAAGMSVGQTYPFDLFYANREPPGAVLALSIPASDLWGCL